MNFMSTVLLNGNIYVFRVPQLQLAYICDTTDPLHKKLVKLCREVHCMWWGNQELELQEF